MLRAQEPYPHLVIDDFLPIKQANSIHRELLSFNKPKEMYDYDNFFEKKKATDQWNHFGPNTKQFLFESLASPFTDFLSKAFDIKGLIADGKLTGGGFHKIETGGFLKPHVDFTRHRDTGLIRRLNAILYMNKSWEEAHGGDLELWEKDMSKCAIKLGPLFNRLVVFETPDNPHGHSAPWKQKYPRMSLALYFYTAPTKEDFDRTHLSTQFLRTPDEPLNSEVEALREERNKGRLATNV